jgi:hypothetical protein
MKKHITAYIAELLCLVLFVYVFTLTLRPVFLVMAALCVVLLATEGIA